MIPPPVSPVGSTWDDAPACRLSEVLGRVAALSLPELVAALRQDQEQRWRRGERVPAEAYLRLRPDLADGGEEPFDLVYGEYLLREEAGEVPDPAEFRQRFPCYAARLDRQLTFRRELLDEEPPAAGSKTLRLTPSATHDTDRGKEAAPKPLPFPGSPLPSGPAGYEILGELGRGGMGVVYKARRVALDRVVALKMVLAGAFVGDEHVARFLVEAKTVASLSHPNIVHIYDLGIHEGRPFLSLEYLEGGSLAHRLQGAPQPARDAAAVVEQLAGAMDYAHARGVIHRDLKPANVLLARDGTPKITDFGLAKQQDSAGLTMTGVVMGTPNYMAPEQARGDSRQVGPAADIYALGAILYEILTGQPPFAGSSPMEVMSRLVVEEVPSPLTLRPELPRDLATVCLRCLEKQPGRRYPSAGALAEDLRRFQHGERILARPVGELERLGRWAQRRPAVAALLLLALVSLVAGSAVSTYFGLAARQAETEAIHARNVAQRQAAELLLDRGLARAGRGETAQGMHWMLAALRALPDGDPEADRLREVIRTNLAAWATSVPRLRAVWDHADVVSSVAFSPDGTTAATGCYDGRVYFWQPGNDTPVQTLVTGDENVYALAFSPDGRTLATGHGHAHDRNRREQQRTFRAQIWDVATGQAKGPVLAHDGLVQAVAFSPDGRTLLTGTCKSPHGYLEIQAAVRFWDAATGRLRFARWPVPLANANVLTAEFSPDGTRALITTASHVPGEPGAYYFLDPTTGQPPAGAGPVTGTESAIFAPDNEHLWVRTTRDAMQRLPLIQRDRQMLHPPSPDREFPGLGGGQPFLTPDGQTLGMASNNEISLWETATGRPLAAAIPNETAVAGGQAFAPDGTRLLTAGGSAVRSALGRLARSWDLGRPLSRPAAPPGRGASTYGTWRRAYRWAYHAGRGVVAVADPGPENRPDAVRLRDVRTGRPLGAPLRHPDFVRAITFNPDGTVVATACHDRAVRLWDGVTGRQIGPPLPHQNWPAALAFSPDGRLLAVGDYGPQGRVVLWDTQTARPVQVLVHDDIILCVAFSPDGRTLAAGTSSDWSGKPLVRLWDVASGERRGPDLSHDGRLYFLAFRPDGQALLTGASDQAVRLWDVATGRQLGEPVKHSQEVLHACFSPDGKSFLTASANGRVRLCDAATSRVLPGAVLTHTAAVMRAAFSPDGRLLVAACADGSARLWDVATRKPLGPPAVLRGWLIGTDFLPDGRSFLTTAEDGTSRVWPVPAAPSDLAAEAIERPLQVWTGMELGDEQTVVPLDPVEWRRRRDQVGPTPAWFTLPDDAAWHDARAQDAEQDGDWFAVSWHLERLVKLRPGDWLVQARRGRALAVLGRAGQADAALKLAATQAPGPAFADWCRHGLLDAENVRNDALALEYLNRLVASQPGEWQLYADRAEAYRRLGRAADCEADQARAVAKGADVGYLVRLADERAGQGRWREADRLFDQARKSPLPLPARLAAALVKRRRKDDAGLARAWAELATAGPATIEDVHAMLDGFLFAARTADDRAKGLAFTDRLLADLERPNWPPALREQELRLVTAVKAGLLYQSGQPEAARKVLLPAADDSPVAAMQQLLGVLLRPAGQADEARRDLEAARKRCAALRGRVGWADRLKLELLLADAEEVVKGLPTK